MVRPARSASSYRDIRATNVVTPASPDCGEAGSAALPEELLCDIFRRLDLSGRLAVSHVCKLWRQAALADCVLWTKYSILLPAKTSGADSASAAKADALSAFLARSDPMPFSLRADYVPDAIAEIVIAHAHRMRALRLDNFQTRSAMQRLLSQDVPVLKSFSCHFPASSDGPLPFSPQWADGSSSHLEHLDVGGRWLWPQGCMTTSLRSLRGTLPEVLSPTWRLAELFPNLMELDLPAIQSQSHIDLLEPLPRTLTSLRLISASGPVDYSRVVRQCKARGLRLLEIGDPGSRDSFQEAVKLFVRTFSGQWALRVTYTDVELSSTGTNTPYRYRINARPALRLATTPGLLSSWARVYELEIRLTLLLDLWETFVPGTSLPSLRTLRVQTSGDHFSRALRDLGNGTHVEAPALTSTSITVWDPPPGTPVLAIVKVIMRAFRSPTLANVDIHTTDPKCVSVEAPSEFKGLAERLTVRNHRGKSVATYIFTTVGGDDI